MGRYELAHEFGQIGLNRNIDKGWYVVDGAWVLIDRSVIVGKAWVGNLLFGASVGNLLVRLRLVCVDGACILIDRLVCGLNLFPRVEAAPLEASSAPQGTILKQKINFDERKNTEVLTESSSCRGGRGRQGVSPFIAKERKGRFLFFLSSLGDQFTYIVYYESLILKLFYNNPNGLKGTGLGTGSLHIIFFFCNF